MFDWTKKISRETLNNINFACFGFWIGYVVILNGWNSLIISVVGLQLLLFSTILRKNLLDKENEKEAEKKWALVV